MHALLNPTNDYVFKRIFAEAPELLRALINELTGKYIILDVLARDADGHCYNVEVQVRRYGAWHKRGLFYLARTLGGQLTAGEDYQELRASVGLHLLDFDLFTATERQRQQALWRFEMRDETQPQVSLGNILQMNLVELNKADRLGLPPGPLRAWITFFKHWQEELTMATVAHEPVQQAMDRIRQLSADEEARRLAFVRERALHDEVSFLNEAKREGMQEGMEKGMEKGRLDEARDALRVQLNTKFGALPSWVEEQLGTAEHERLRALMRDLLFADSLDGLFKH